jgi:hypothetical protein
MSYKEKRVPESESPPKVEIFHVAGVVTLSTHVETLGLLDDNGWLLSQPTLSMFRK